MKIFDFTELIFLLISVELILATGLSVTNKNTRNSVLGSGNIYIYIYMCVCVCVCIVE